MIRHQDVDPSKLLDGLGHKTASGSCPIKIAGQSPANRRPAFIDQRLGLSLGLLISENDFGIGRGKQTYGGRANAARTASDQRNFSGER